MRCRPRAARRIGALLLAAGGSTRMGPTNKLLSEIGGIPLVARVADALVAAGAEPILVVTGHDAPRVRAALAGRNLRFVHHAGWQEGMGSSLAAGARALPGDLDGVLIALGDMPALRPGPIRALIGALDPEAGRTICQPVCAGRRGHPVLFGARHFAELGELRGDAGARGLVEAHADALCAVEVEDPGVLLDVDTPEQLARARVDEGPA